MAGHDLVVKLLLDSGAFGNNLREAEYKAKQFSTNMKSAGKTAGDFTKEIGLSTGALGKMGAVMAGAAGVVALVGAFKNIMNSTHTTAKMFQGTVSGLEGSLTQLSRSLATLDFTDFNNGMYKAFKNAKALKETMMDIQQSSITYSFLTEQDKTQLKDLETQYRNPNATDSEREALKAKALEITENARIVAEQRATQLYDGFLKQMADKTNSDRLKIKDKDGKILISEETALQWMREVAIDMQDGTVDNSAYEKYLDELEDLDKKKKKAKKDKDESMMLFYEVSKRFKTDANQEAIFKNTLSTMPLEQLEATIKLLTEGQKSKREASELELQVRGWSAGTTQVNTPTEEDYIILENSIADLEKDIDELEKKRGGMIVGSDDWIAATKNIAELNSKLKEQKKLQEELDKTYKVIPPPDEVEGSIAALRKLIAEQEKLRDDQVVGSDKWTEHNSLVMQYTAALKEAEAAQKKFNGEIEAEPEMGSFAAVQKNIKILEDLTNNVEVGSIGWETAMRMLNYYKEQLKELEKTQEEFTNQFISDEERKVQAIEKFNEKLENRNAALSSTAVVLNGIGDMILAYEEDLGEKTAGLLSGVTNLFGEAINGVMSFIQVQQACATATGVTKAAAMPFPYNLAAIGTVVGTLMSVFASIKQMANSAGKFAEGGIVGGTSYSGDKLFAMVNSGEMILNKKQQGNLVNMLGGGGQVEFHISGDSLVGVLNNKQRKQNLIR